MSPAPHHIRTEDLSAYIDGMLSDHDRSDIANHLATCAACRVEFSELRATVRLLNQLPQFASRRSLQLGMDHDTHRRRHSPVIRLLPVVRSLGVAAVILFMVAAGAVFLGTMGDDVDQSTAPRSEAQSETGATDDASQGVGQAGNAGETETSDERLIDRGAAASSGEDPLEDLTTLQEAQQSAADQASADVARVDTGSNVQNRLTSEYGVALVIGLGVLALALVCFWIVLARMSRPGHRLRH